MDFAFHKSIAENLLKKTEKEVEEIEASDLAPEMKIAQRYRVMQLAFDEIIEESKSYKDILKTIKMSYDDYLQHLEESNFSSITLSSKLKNMAARTTTLSNLRKRGDQLEENLLRLRAQNEYLKEEMLSMDMELSEHSSTGQNFEIFAREPPKKAPKSKKAQMIESARTGSSKQIFDQLGVSECLDEEKLRDTLRSLSSQLEVLEERRRNLFISKEDHDECWEEYAKKTDQRSLLENTYFDLQKELYLISVANEAAESYNEKEVIGKTIAEHVYESLVQAFMRSVQFADQLDENSRDELLGETEASNIIHHVEHFHILFDEKRYEQAAWHAADSPKGVMRNAETFRKFKEVQDNNPNERIMYHYAKAIMSTQQNGTTTVLNDEMSSEFVRAMVKTGEQKLVYQWFQNGWLSTSKQVADLLACDKHNQVHGSVVAENIYMRLGLYHDAIRCMAFRGDIPAAISFAQDTACFERADYIDLLLSVPSVKLARALSMQKYPGKDQVLLPCGQIALLLLKDINIEVAGEFLRTLDFTLLVLAQNVAKLEEASSQAIIEPNCIFSDKETSSEDWLHIVKQLEHTVYEDLGVEIVTALSVNDALTNSLSNSI